MSDKLNMARRVAAFFVQSVGIFQIKWIVCFQSLAIHSPATLQFCRQKIYLYIIVCLIVIDSQQYRYVSYLRSGPPRYSKRSVLFIQAVSS